MLPARLPSILGGKGLQAAACKQSHWLLVAEGYVSIHVGCQQHCHTRTILDSGNQVYARNSSIGSSCRHPGRRPVPPAWVNAGTTLMEKQERSSWTGMSASPLGRLQVQGISFFRCLEGAWSHFIPDADDAREARGESRGQLCIAELCSCSNAVHLLPWSIDAHQSAAHSQEGCPPE
mmetsp:Transcript_10063/g.20797  ORF Transcript_10063/g.20797 Transcript_10063/m.20797 type:complete len:177 (+) Transcript_10063:401-931(+)